MVFPVGAGSISAVYGPTNEQLDGPYNGYAHFNKGVDIAVPQGTPMGSVTAGTVIRAGPNGTWGNQIQIRDSQGYIHTYNHLSSINVAVGTQVSPGMVVGKTGSTGSSTGPHLSYDVIDPGGRYINPGLFLGADLAGDNRTGHRNIGRSVWDLGVAGGQMTSYPQAGGQLQGGDTTAGAAGAGGPSVDEFTKYWEMRREYNDLYSKYSLWLSDSELATELGMPKPTPEQLQRLLYLDGAIADFDETYGENAGFSPGEIADAYDFWNANDPRVVDAMNAAEKYTRDFDERVEAANIAADRLSEQTNRIRDAQSSQEAFSAGRSGEGPRTTSVVSMPQRIVSGEDLFNTALTNLEAGLPEVPDMPYPERYGSSPLDILTAGAGPTIAGGYPGLQEPPRKPAVSSLPSLNYANQGNPTVLGGGGGGSTPGRTGNAGSTLGTNWWEQDNTRTNNQNVLDQAGRLATSAARRGTSAWSRIRGSISDYNPFD